MKAEIQRLKCLGPGGIGPGGIGETKQSPKIIWDLNPEKLIVLLLQTAGNASNRQTLLKIFGRII